MRLVVFLGLMQLDQCKATHLQFELAQTQQMLMPHICNLMQYTHQGMAEFALSKQNLALAPGMESEPAGIFCVQDTNYNVLCRPLQVLRYLA